jgi:tRNA-splicing ligase RtcB (3'-phosphate/5'-hydroxy nucleic acid ligase)
MNARQLRELGLPDSLIPLATSTVRDVIASGAKRGREVKELLRQIVAQPASYVDDAHFGSLAKELTDPKTAPARKPISYQTWGSQIDREAHGQMRNACAVPSAVAGALMPDAHVGYGLPIGGVLATEGTVIPYAVGVDIACRMKLSVLDLPVSHFVDKREPLARAIERGTRFGIGSAFERKQMHAVMDQDWTITRITRENKDKAWKQLGSSGSGNHFVEFGLLTLPTRDESLGLDAGEYVALLSHSGSRGTGASVCSTYSAIAQRQLPTALKDFGQLAWLSLDSTEGQEYWQAMNLMGDYAAANHEVIHRNVAKESGARIMAGVENHHNFAWKEVHHGRELVVHRKGATPAAAGVMGIIPGSMGSPAFVVRGKGNPASLESASHGAGRCMSRTQAKNQFRFSAIRQDLAARGIDVISAGSDEVPGVYKKIEEVMAEQTELVETVARFDPKIVKMCGDDSRAED